MNKTNTPIALAPQAITSSTTTLGEIIDLADTEKHFFAVQLGVFTDGTYTFVIEHGNETNLSDAADVVEADQIRGNLYNTAIAPSGDKRVYIWELLSKFKRFARLKVISASVTSGTLIGATVVERRLKTSFDNDRNVA